MLEIKNLNKKFANFLAVKDLNLKVNEGELFSLIGPNGSGKTTIIKNILGLLRPSSGDILINGESIKDSPIKVKEQLAYIPDEPKIWNHITGEEFLYFSGALYGMKKEDISKKIPELLAHFNLKGIEKKYFENYSRGNKQKFSILAALLHNPKLILVDEPIVGLDPESAEIAMNLLHKFTKSGGTVFMTTHTLPVAQKYSSKIGILHQGELIATNTLDNLRKEIKSDSASLSEIYFNFTKHA
ncbi:ABC transporter ATP-binding protein [Patescibacteria group bacterium]|nr:ABC transporter ATP-binding protein [Patescibacteria group bacterium]